MRSMLFVVVSFLVTILAWGMYGPVLHWGQDGMQMGEAKAMLRPFMCVGFAYFGIGVIAPAVFLKLKGEKGSWTTSGIIFSLAGGALGAIGALGIIMAFKFGGRPVFVMPLVFGGAPVVNSFITITLAKRLKEIGPLFGAGLVMVLLGAVTVLTFAPKKDKTETQEQTSAVQTEEKADEAGDSAAGGEEEPKEHGLLYKTAMLVLSIALVIVCWGAYGPVLHKGQAAMEHSRMRPLLCVGLAYFAIAVLVPWLWLTAVPEESAFTFSGTFWSLSAGAAGAIGALGIIMAFNFGGRPIYVMPLVFGGAPVVNTLMTTMVGGLWSELNAIFVAGLILVIAGAAMVLVFAPKGPPPGSKPEEEVEKKEEPKEEAQEETTEEKAEGEASEPDSGEA